NLALWDPAWHRIALPHLLSDPLVSRSHPILERDGRLPAKHLTETRVVGVAPTHSLRTGDVLLHNPSPGYAGDHVCEFVDRDQPVLPQVERFRIVRAH